MRTVKRPGTRSTCVLHIFLMLFLVICHLNNDSFVLDTGRLLWGTQYTKKVVAIATFSYGGLEVESFF